MTAGRYVGRVGALAVLLGVGLAVGATPAWADPDSTASSTDAADADTATDAPTARTTDGSATPATNDIPASDPTPSESPSATTEQVAPGVTVSSSDGAHTSGGNTSASPKKRTPKPPEPATVSAQSARGESAGSAVAPPDRRTAAVTFAPATAATVAVTAVSEPPGVTPSLTTAAVAVLSAPVTIVGGVLQTLFGGHSPASIESPLAWAVAAVTRRELGTASTQPSIAAQTTTSRTLAAADTPNLPPQLGDPVFGTPDPFTGAVTGRVVAVDPEGKKLSYTVTSKPSDGKLTISSSTGVFTYTPTQAQRIAAQVQPGPQTVSFTVRVSDGVTANRQSTTIDVEVAPTQIADIDRIDAGTRPYSIAANNTHAYIANNDAGTVTVIDTIHGTTVGTISVGTAPTGVAITPNGKKVYVANSGDGTVSVIDTTTNTVTGAPIVLSGVSPTTLTVSPNGSTLWVGGIAVDADGAPARNGNLLAGGSVTRISVKTDKVTGTTRGVGDEPLTIAVTPDGTKAFVVSAELDPDTLDIVTSSVYVAKNTSSTAQRISGLGGATALVVSPDGTRVLVAGPGRLTIIRADNYSALAVTPLSGLATALAFSTDGKYIFAATQVGNVGVYNADGGGLLLTVPTQSVSVNPFSTLALSPDGQQLYLLGVDQLGYAMHVVSMLPRNEFPAVPPAVVNPPSTSGVVTGTIASTDPDGDTLTYTASTPARGKVVLRSDGTFTYTPTSAARHAAAADGVTALTDAFTITVSDGRRGIVTQTVTVDILPANTPPATKSSVSSPSSSTGAVKGSVTATDKDRDTLTYAVTTDPAKGSVTLDAKGKFVYTPTADARHAAATPDPAAKTDTFTVTVTDGHGGVSTQTVSVKISPTNARPDVQSAAAGTPDADSGVVAGTVVATDTDGDALTMTAAPKKGGVEFGPDGTFTYTPTQAARQAASAPNASSSTKSDSFTVTVSDGHGGKDTVTVKVAIAPL